MSIIELGKKILRYNYKQENSNEKICMIKESQDIQMLLIRNMFFGQKISQNRSSLQILQV